MMTQTDQSGEDAPRVFGIAVAEGEASSVGKKRSGGDYAASDVGSSVGTP